MATYNVYKGVSGVYTNTCPSHSPVVLGAGYACDIDDPNNGGSAVIFKVLNADFGEVTQIRDSCNGNAGKSVIVTVMDGGREVRVLAYTHIEPSVSVGDQIAQNGVVGTIGDYSPYNDPDCWTGPHLHQEWLGAFGQDCLNGSSVVGSITG